jgi:hypothetical protein
MVLHPYGCTQGVGIPKMVYEIGQLLILYSFISEDIIRQFPIRIMEVFYRKILI